MISEHMSEFIIKPVVLSFIIVGISVVHMLFWVAETARTNGKTLIGEETYEAQRINSEYTHVLTEEQKVWLTNQLILFALAGYIGCFIAVLVKNLEGEVEFIDVWNAYYLTVLYAATNCAMIYLARRKKELKVSIVGEVKNPLLRGISIALLFLTVTEGYFNYVEVNTHKAKGASNIKNNEILLVCNDNHAVRIDDVKNYMKVLNMAVRFGRISVVLSCPFDKG